MITGKKSYETQSKKLKALVTLSFDDGREDTYRVAYKIMKEFGLVGTIHVTTGWVDGSWSPSNWASAVNGAMTVEQVQECFKNGFEIASHGDKHIADLKDLLTSLNKLKKWGVLDEKRFGFSSPNSEITRESRPEVIQLLKENNLMYVRTGRAPYCYKSYMKGIYILQKLSGSKLFFRFFNRHNTIKLPVRDSFVLHSSVIKSNNSAIQIIDFLKSSIGKNSWNILMLHSILRPDDKGYGKDAWCWDADNFRILCSWLNNAKNDISTVTIKDGLMKFLPKYDKI